jgi:Ran GTPase-activating protein (RanGAP) involved in mRNA processing and transport
MPDDDPARLDVEDHAHELLALHRDEWAAPLLVANDWEFRRGFIERVTLSGQAFLARAERLFAGEPIRHAHLSLRSEDATALAACPELRWLETLAFERCRLRDKAFQAIMASPYLTRLNALVVPPGVEVPGVRALLESGLVARLTSLDFSGNHAFGDRAARLLAAAPGVQKLHVLRLANTNLTPYGVQALIASPHLTHLATLDVAGSDDHLAGFWDCNGVLLQLANLSFLTHLENLNLSYRAIGPSGLRAFVTSSRVAGLRELRLHRAVEDEADAARLLAESEHLAGLTLLDVGGNKIRGEGIQALAESPHLANLTTLRLGSNVLRDSGAKALAASPYLERLTALDLRNNGIGGPGLQALAASENLVRLTDLNLSGNFVGLASVQAIARSAHLTRLTRLDLSNTRFEPGGARVLAESPNLVRLRTLSLSDNQLGNEGAAALAASPLLARLAALRLDNNGIGKNGAEALADSPYLGRLLKLELRGNVFTDDERRRLRARFGSRVVF